MLDEKYYEVIMAHVERMNEKTRDEELHNFINRLNDHFKDYMIYFLITTRRFNYLLTHFTIYEILKH